jgi:membrane carboxypeptidase/penicillin-binding protein PbpC
MRKKIEVLEEKLVPVNKSQINLLKNQIARNPETQRMLTTPMGQIPQYHYLYSSESDYLRNSALFDVIRYLLEYEHRENLYFSKAGNEFTGFIVYEDNGRVIDKIKTASFKDDRIQTNPIFAKDLIEFVLDMASQRSSIEWFVDSENIKAIRQYNILLDKKNFNWKNVKDGKMTKYVVQGFKT